MKSTASETNPNSETLAYYVYGGLNGSNGGDNPAIINGAPNSGLFGDSSDENCSNGSNTDISFAILPADFNAASPGVYSDTLTMFVEPE